MATQTIYVRGSRASVRQAIGQIPSLARSGNSIADAMLREVGKAALTKVKEAYVVKMRGGTDEAGYKWATLSPLTLRKRNRHRRGRPNTDILRDTGRLVRSLSPHSTSMDQVFRIDPGAVTVGTEVSYAKYQHTGTNKMPQRRLWPPPSSWTRQWWYAIMEPCGQGLLKLAIFLFKR